MSEYALLVHFQGQSRYVDPDSGLTDAGVLSNEIAGIGAYTPLVLPLMDGDTLVLASLDGVAFEIVKARG